MATKPRVAICQSHLGPGGRLRVLVGIAQILNEAGVVPDMLTSHLAIRPDEIAERYGRSIEANYRLVPRVPGLPYESGIVWFNAVVSHSARHYDLLINSSNSLICLPKHKKIVTYMHFPRRRRIMGNMSDIHRPHARLRPWSLLGLERAALRQLYRASRMHPNHVTVCNSEFTRAAVEKDYAVLHHLPVIYPPVDIGNLWSARRGRDRAVVTVGRFGPEKRQLQQVKIAERLPNIPFHIIGFVANPHYYQSCELYVEEHGLTNVHFHPDASFAELTALLRESEFFLHTTISEPFGIVVVQAIAAGCLPIVHDSGGQREIVREPELRYQCLDQVPRILERLESLDTSATGSLIHGLQRHIIDSFDATVFHDKMRNALAPHLGLALPNGGLA